ncbi:hypothetical protein Tco_1249867, partial [Tanacetum coccineum]
MRIVVAAMAFVWFGSLGDRYYEAGMDFNSSTKGVDVRVLAGYADVLKLVTRVVQLNDLADDRRDQGAVNDIGSSRAPAHGSGKRKLVTVSSNELPTGYLCVHPSALCEPQSVDGATAAQLLLCARTKWRIEMTDHIQDEGYKGNFDTHFPVAGRGDKLLEMINSHGLVRVVASDNPSYRKKDIDSGMLNWAEYTIFPQTLCSSANLPASER